jgi:hypothetical protein
MEEEAGSGHEDSSHNTNVGCLAVLSGPQVTWVVNVHADTADM